MPKYDPTRAEDMAFNHASGTYLMRHIGGKVSRAWFYADGVNTTAESHLPEVALDQIADVVADFEARAAKPDFAIIPRFFRNPLKINDDGRFI